MSLRAWILGVSLALETSSSPLLVMERCQDTTPGQELPWSWVLQLNQPGTSCPWRHQMLVNRAGRQGITIPDSNPLTWELLECCCKLYTTRGFTIHWLLSLTFINYTCNMPSIHSRIIPWTSFGNKTVLSMNYRNISNMNCFLDLYLGTNPVSSSNKI